LAHPVV